ncbi:hypothetical protein ACFY8W_14930 [Streptomyces sp. NPDC012637]|uniref:hypothetical protein n=1 Tax=Streptomyces sp. NPDC012637 TaxID=3364842 RepID=UPI0036EF7773
MIRRLARTGAVLATASLLLTACSGADDAEPKAAPTKHPVFDQKLDRQMFLALRQTQKAGSASFTQTLTLETKKGKAVQTLEGRLDFAKNTGDANIRWKVPEKYSDAAKDAILGRAPGRSNADATGHFLVDGQDITYRAGSSDYWLRYGYGDYDAGQKTLDQLRGTEAPVGGTLLEGLGGAEAKSRQGANYRAEVDSEPLWEMLPGEISEQLASEMYTPGITRSKKVLLAVSLDRQGRVTHVRADLSRMLGKKGSVFSDATSLTMELTLSGHGGSKPAGRADGDRVLDAGKTVRSIHDVGPGHCVDFSTGQRDAELVADVSCTGPHDGRVLAHASYGGRAYPGKTAAKSQASQACDRAYRRVSDSWTADSAKKDSYWYMWSGEHAWQQAGKGRTTCYVVTAKGAA